MFSYFRIASSVSPRRQINCHVDGDARLSVFTALYTRDVVMSSRAHLRDAVGAALYATLRSVVDSDGLDGPA